MLFIISYISNYRPNISQILLLASIKSRMCKDISHVTKILAFTLFSYCSSADAVNESDQLIMPPLPGAPAISEPLSDSQKISAPGQTSAGKFTDNLTMPSTPPPPPAPSLPAIASSIHDDEKLELPTITKPAEKNDNSTKEDIAKTEGIPIELPSVTPLKPQDAPEMSPIALPEAPTELVSPPSSLITNPGANAELDQNNKPTILERVKAWMGFVQKEQTAAASQENTATTPAPTLSATPEEMVDPLLPQADSNNAAAGEQNNTTTIWDKVKSWISFGKTEQQVALPPKFRDNEKLQLPSLNARDEDNQQQNLVPSAVPIETTVESLGDIVADTVDLRETAMAKPSDQTVKRIVSTETPPPQVQNHKSSKKTKVPTEAELNAIEHTQKKHNHSEAQHLALPDDTNKARHIEQHHNVTPHIDTAQANHSAKSEVQNPNKHDDTKHSKSDTTHNESGKAHPNNNLNGEADKVVTHKEKPNTAKTNNKKVNKEPKPLSPETLDFISKEVTLLMNDNDDVVLGHLTDDAVKNMMSGKDYIKLFLTIQDEIASLQSALYVNQFVNSLYSHPNNLIVPDEIITLTQEAVLKGDINLVRSMINNYPDLLEARDVYGNSLLHLAIKRRNYDLIKLLLMYGIENNPYNDFLESPIDLAPRNGKIARLIEEAR